MIPDGLTIYTSQRNPKQTMDRAAAAVAEYGLSVFARIDHAAAAEAAGLELRATEVLIFGNAKIGTPLMKVQQTAGIDLPQKILVWQREDGGVSLAYNDPYWLAKRHLAEHGADQILRKMATTLAAIATKAVG